MPSNHDQYEGLIPDLLTGRLSQSESEEVRMHAESCERCSRTIAELSPLFSQLGDDKSGWLPPGYFSTVLPNVRARIEGARGGRSSEWFPTFALPAAGLVLVVMVILTLNLPWEKDAPGPESITQAIGEVPADVLADALADQADRAGIIDGSLSEVIPDERLELEIMRTLIIDPTALGELESSSEALLPTDLSETEVTILLQRLSEREVL